MTDVRADLRDIFAKILEPKVNTMPESYMGISPIGEFADAAADYMGTAPALPKYRPDEEQPVYSAPIMAEDLMDGSAHRKITVYISSENLVTIAMRVGEDLSGMVLAPGIAEQFFLQGLAVVRHAREQAGS